VSVTKTWEVTSDNPRASHAEMSGETVDIKDTFSNGLRFPGDASTGDASEVANCTCVMSIDGGIISETEAKWTDEFAKDTKFDPVDARQALVDYSRKQGVSIQELQSAIDNTAKQLVDAAVRNESAVSEALQAMAGDTGGELLGFDFRLKTVESLRGKLLRDAIENEFELSPAQSGETIRDVLRYTFGFEENAYTEGAMALRETLAGNYGELKWNPSWDSSVYRGLNAQFRTTGGYEFEIQFHTPTSFAAKNGPLHKLYEQFRVLNEASEEAQAIQAEMTAITESIPIPPNWEQLLEPLG